VGRPAPDSNTPDIQVRTVGLDYFRVMGIKLRSGRDFGELDRADAPRTVVVNQAFVDQVLAGEDGVGQRVSFVFMNSQPLEIVGVVANENVGDLDGRIRGVLYFPWLQERSPSMSVLVRTQSDPDAFAGSLRTQSLALEPGLVVSNLISMDSLILGSQPTFLRRYPLLLLGAFACLALALASIGIYGVMSYSVSQRTSEIGVRLALGARPDDVLRLVLKQGLQLALAGIAAGLGAGLITARTLKTFLFDTRPTDPVVFAATALGLIGVAGAACFFPARRAARIDPLAALRAE
jgi:predicted permease